MPEIPPKNPNAHPPASLMAPVKDPILYGLLALGAIAFAMPVPLFQLSILSLAGKALVEELVFRSLLQDMLSEKLGNKADFGPITTGNLVCSALFAALHLASHQSAMGLLTFAPSLVFGFAWDRYRRLWPVWLLHFAYNLLLFKQEQFIAFFR